MRRNLWKVSGLGVCLMAAVLLVAPAAHGREVFVVSADINGNASFLASNGDGTFGAPENLVNMGLHGISGRSYGNGIGDFDNDGDLDYITANGFRHGSIYILEKIGAGNQFGPPIAASTWDAQYFPMDLAVADYNEDGDLDFVMAYSKSSNTGLYLGDGDFGFAYHPLTNTAPNYPAGVDAADFNNDGHADFAVAPYSQDGQIYVNLGLGNGTFTTLTFDTHDGNAVWGIAAADFDNDGNADLVTAYNDFLIVYTGNGDGTFDWLASYDFEMNASPLDNGDFDGDGNQDLVAADYGSDGRAVVIFLGDGHGVFSLGDIYSDKSLKQRKAVTGLPYERNQQPVAVIDPVAVEIIAGQEVVFDGSGSYDEDGRIVRYAWDFGDGVSLPGKAGAGNQGAEVAPPHAYYEPGSYTVTLTVTDDQGAVASAWAQVKVTAVPATIRFVPRVLTLPTRGKWLWATIKLPPGYDARTIDRASVRIVAPNVPPVFAAADTGLSFWGKIMRRLGWREKFLTVRFDRRAVAGVLKNSGLQTVLNVRGELAYNNGWMPFAGSATIRTIDRNRHRGFFHRFAKRYFKRHQKTRTSGTCRYDRRH